MPCNARVMVKATVDIDNADLSAFTQRGDRYTMRLGPDVVVDIYKGSKKAEIKSMAPSWDEGVRQLKNTIKYLQGKGIVVKDAGQPETHRHDHPGPWQKQGVY